MAKMWHKGCPSKFTFAQLMSTFRFLLSIILIFFISACQKDCKETHVYHSGFAYAGGNFKAYTDKETGRWVEWITPQGKTYTILDTLKITAALPDMDGTWKAVITGNDCDEEVIPFTFQFNKTLPCPMISNRFYIKDEVGPFSDSAVFTNSFSDTTGGRYTILASDINSGFSLRITFKIGVSLPEFGMFTLNDLLFDPDEARVVYTYQGNQESLYNTNAYLFVSRGANGKYTFSLCPVRYNMFTPRRVSFTFTEF